ncbi:MAG TPA: lysylphosphatidylglycerol synthase transmembrane domain-containing protein [Gemmatimonadaceae bacterium]
MKIGWRGILGVVISIALLWWTLRGESFSEIWSVLRESNLALFVLSAAVATTTFPIRAWRWRYILEPTAGTLPFGPLWRATAIGMMVNNVSPARAGELARAFVLSRETGRVRFTAALASLVVDRVFDAIVVLLLLLIVVLMPAFPAGAMIGNMPVDRVLLLSAGVAIAALLVLIFFAMYPEKLVRIWEMLLGHRAPRLMARGRDILNAFGAGLSVLKDPRRSLIVFLLALGGWLVNGASFWIAFLAVGIEAPFSAALFLQSLLAMAVAIPSAPGFFGLFEAGAKVALGVYLIDDTLAVSYALGYHLLSFIPITLIGFWYLARLGLHLKDMSDGGRETGAGPS